MSRPRKHLLYQRYLEIKKLRGDGKTLQEIADLLGISRQRVHQLAHWDWKNPDYVKTPHEWRLEVLNMFDAKCKRCGFLDIRALQIDHVNGGGSKELKKYSEITYYQMLLSLPEKELKEKYQVLCANCNWIKKSENKEVYKGKKREYSHLLLENP